MKKYDERETLFSRIRLKKGTREYKDFYKKNRKSRQPDDKQRGVYFRDSLRKDKYFKDLFFPLVKNNKEYIKTAFDMAESKEVNPVRVNIDKAFSSNLKEIAKYYGATDVGIVKLTDYSYYSHQGGLSDAVNISSYNNKILPKFNTAIVFTVVMDKEKINRAPHFEELLATEEAYLQVAMIGSRMAVYLKDLGYNAMFNNSEFYYAPMVPLAYDAGLGEIGMCNHIVTKKHGNNVRIGAVFTTLEVNNDKPVDFGLVDFCKKCALCLSNCPTGAITHLPRMVNGRRFYKFDDNKCYDMWIKSGTDCGTFTQGIDDSTIDQIKDNPLIIDEIMEKFVSKHGRRVYQKEELDIVKLEVTNANND